MCSKQPGLSPRSLLCPSSCLPAADPSDGRAREALKGGKSLETCSKAGLYFGEEPAERGNVHEAVLSALCAPWVQAITNSSSCGVLALLWFSPLVVHDCLFWALITTTKQHPKQSVPVPGSVPPLCRAKCTFCQLSVPSALQFTTRVPLTRLESCLALPARPLPRRTVKLPYPLVEVLVSHQHPLRPLGFVKDQIPSVNTVLNISAVF